MVTATTARRVDVVVVGDGPAGSALAQACRRRNLDTVLVGADDPWTATYASWLDDLDDVAAVDGPGLFSSVMPTVGVATATGGVRSISRAYGVLDNDELRRRLRADVDHHVGLVVALPAAPTAGRWRVAVADGTALDGRLLIDATGWPPRARPGDARTAPAWQTAFGVVLPEPPDGSLGAPTFMDFRPVTLTSGQASTIGPAGVATFAYALPVADGWLVEETVLASEAVIEPIALLPRLGARLGRHPDRLLADAVRTEYVRIPLGVPPPRRDAPMITFGAAAGYVHPATGFSVAASLRAAPRVAGAVERALRAAPADGVVDVSHVREAVWSPSARRTRALHDHGLRVLLDLTPEQIAVFFDVFYDQPVERWRDYLRLDAGPLATAAFMSRMFRSAPWPLRRRLATAHPVRLARALLP